MRRSFRRTITESIRFPGNKWPPAMGKRVPSTRYRNTLYKERPGQRKWCGAGGVASEERGGVRWTGGGGGVGRQMITFEHAAAVYKG